MAANNEPNPFAQGNASAPQMGSVTATSAPPPPEEPYPGQDIPDKATEYTGHAAEGSRFECHGCKDILFAILFYAGMISVISLCGTYKGDEKYLDIDTSGSHVEKYIGISLGIACAWVIIWIVIMFACARCLIYFGFAVCTLLLATGAIWGFGAGYWIAGIIFSVMTVMTVVYFYLIRLRIKLATKMIHICVGVLFQNPLVFVAAFLTVCWMVGYYVLCFVAALRTCGYYHGQNDDDKAWGLLFFFILMAAWGLEIARNVVHVTSCGVLGQWYKYDNAMSTIPAYLKALTVNFGSICLGSLMVAAVELLRAFLMYIKERQCADNCCVKFIFCCIDCCLGCVEGCFRLINSYAYVHVAVDGMGFCHAAKAALDFLEGAGLTAVINDDIVHKFIFAGSFIGGFFNGCFVASLGKDNNDFDSGEATVWGLTFGIISFFFIQIMLSPLLSSVEALLVLFAEDPVMLHNSHEETYHSFIKTWREVFGGASESGETCDPECVKHAENRVQLWRQSQNGEMSGVANQAPIQGNNQVNQV